VIHSALRLVSGGQTGVDRAALDVARELGLEHGGWCPRGRLAEDGEIPACYPLRETASADYRVRTEQNVVDSDGTLIVTAGEPSGGTALTITFCRKHDRPCCVVDLDDAGEGGRGEVLRWLRGHAIRTLNVAGPRESGAPGIGARAAGFLRRVLTA
jgi:hypothetical protein